MSHLQHEIRIAAPIERVWAVLADLEAVQNYNPTVKEARYTSPIREGVGASRRCSLIPKGWVTERVTAWEPNTAVALELGEHQWPVTFMRWRTELAADGSGTRVLQRLEYQVKFGLLGAFLDRMVMRRKLDQAIGDVFDGLKRYVETGNSRRTA